MQASSGGFHILRKLNILPLPHPLVTYRNQQILFPLSAFWGGPSPLECGRHIWKPPHSAAACNCPSRCVGLLLATTPPKEGRFNATVRVRPLHASLISSRPSSMRRSLSVRSLLRSCSEEKRRPKALRTDACKPCILQAMLSSAEQHIGSDWMLASEEYSNSGSIAHLIH